MSPEKIRDMINFVEGRLVGAKEILNWLAQELAKEEEKEKENGSK